MRCQGLSYQKRVNGTCPGLANTSLVAILAEDPQPFNRAHKYLSPAHISIEVVFHPEEVAIFPYLFIHWYKKIQVSYRVAFDWFFYI